MPKLSLDETFEQQSGISVAVKTELDSIMSSFGYNILNALVTDIIPDVKVKDAMNDINAAQRAQVAAQARGEADKILKVKQAEAEAESKALQGKGIAAERQAIIDGLRASIENFRESVPGSTPATSWLSSCSPSTSTPSRTSAPSRQQHHLPAQLPRRRQRLHNPNPRRPQRQHDGQHPQHPPPHNPATPTPHHLDPKKRVILSAAKDLHFAVAPPTPEVHPSEALRPSRYPTKKVSS